MKRVGCFAGSLSSDWNATTQHALESFNKRAGTKLDIKLASIDVLDVIKAMPSRVCPLVCTHGFRADGDSCARIACRAGYRVNDDNECEKISEKKSVAPRAVEAKQFNIERSPTVSQQPTTAPSGGGNRRNGSGCNTPAVRMSGNC